LHASVAALRLELEQERQALRQLRFDKGEWHSQVQGKLMDMQQVYMYVSSEPNASAALCDIPPRYFFARQWPTRHQERNRQEGIAA